MSGGLHIQNEEFAMLKGVEKLRQLMVHWWWKKIGPEVRWLAGDAQRMGVAANAVRASSISGSGLWAYRKTVKISRQWPWPVGSHHLSEIVWTDRFCGPGWDAASEVSFRRAA